MRFWLYGAGYGSVVGMALSRVAIIALDVFAIIGIVTVVKWFLTRKKK